MEGEVQVLSLEPNNLGDILENILTVGEMTGRQRKPTDSGSGAEEPA